MNYRIFLSVWMMGLVKNKQKFADLKVLENSRTLKLLFCGELGSCFSLYSKGCDGIWIAWCDVGLSNVLYKQCGKCCWLYFICDWCVGIVVLSGFNFRFLLLLFACTSVFWWYIKPFWTLFLTKVKENFRSFFQHFSPQFS